MQANLGGNKNIPSTVICHFKTTRTIVEGENHER